MPTPSTPRKYIVKAGDCLWNIAKNQSACALLWHDIARLNGLHHPFVIFVGQPINLPGAVAHPHANAQANGQKPKTVDHHGQISAKHVFNRSVSVNLDGREVNLFGAGWEATLKLHGELTFRRKGDAPFSLDFCLQDQSITLVKEAEDARQRFVLSAEYKITPQGIEIGFGGHGLDGPAQFIESTVSVNLITNTINYSSKLTALKMNVGVIEVEGTFANEVEVKGRKMEAAELAQVILKAVVSEARGAELEMEEILRPPEAADWLKYNPTVHWVPYGVVAAALMLMRAIAG